MNTVVEKVNGKSVLIVEDHTALAELLTTMLAMYGMRVSCAESGSKALQQLERAVSDIILLDVVLPDMDGLDVITLVRQNEKLKHIPIVAITAAWEKKEPCLRRGCDSFLLKPFDAVRLVSRISALVH